jgi:hypothetical protein
MVAVPSVPELHRGTVYRSRTEARWAEFFYLTGTPVEYEPDRYQLVGVRYVPDFRLKQAEAFFEVKGGSPTLPERTKAHRLARQWECPVVLACGNPALDCEVLCFMPDGDVSQCFFVEEHKGEGVWVAEFLDGGGWAFPLKYGLVNCAAYGRPHPKLEQAGRLQFNLPDLPEHKIPPPEHTVGDWELASKIMWPVLKNAWQRMKRGEDK